jgi:lysozyme
VKPSQKCVDVVKSFEGFRTYAYLCPANIWTIGYGSTKNVKKGDTITKDEAEKLLLSELEDFSAKILPSITTNLNQNELDSLVSFSYNVGVSAFKNSTLLKKLNKGDKSGAAAEFLKWNKANGKELKGLTRRRQCERQLFLGIDNKPVVA